MIHLKIQNIFIALIVILVCGTSYGQVEIRGKVISDISKDSPWYGYYIKPNINEHPTSFPDASGEYVIEFLEPNKEYEIIVTAPGYQDKLLSIKTNDSITYKAIEIKAICEYDSAKAEYDWENEQAQFLLIGSIAPIANTRSDNRFEEKYNIEYYDFGCMMPNYECIELYNQRMAQLMDERFGKKWRKKARTDIIGI
tara:strand:+ start:2273 stop:2863 length:591 start_codon:yes stop_codon:yes gene_type:complete